MLAEFNQCRKIVLKKKYKNILENLGQSLLIQ
jgi:hypothetical protein